MHSWLLAIIEIKLLSLIATVTETVQSLPNPSKHSFSSVPNSCNIPNQVVYLFQQIKNTLKLNSARLQLLRWVSECFLLAPSQCQLCWLASSWHFCLTNAHDTPLLLRQSTHPRVVENSHPPNTLSVACVSFANRRNGQHLLAKRQTLRAKTLGILRMGSFSILTTSERARIQREPSGWKAFPGEKFEPCEAFQACFVRALYRRQMFATEYFGGKMVKKASKMYKFRFISVPLSLRMGCYYNIHLNGTNLILLT